MVTVINLIESWGQGNAAWLYLSKGEINMADEGQQEYPISKWRAVPNQTSRQEPIPPKEEYTEGEWVFVKLMPSGSYEGALAEAGRLQKDDPTWQYRIWDCR